MFSCLLGAVSMHVSPSWQSTVFAGAVIADGIWGIMACPNRAIDLILRKCADASGFQRSAGGLFGAVWLVRGVTQRCGIGACSDSN